MATVVRRSEIVPRPWTNGGGTTRELLRAEDGSWRVSLADIDRAIQALIGSDRALKHRLDVLISIPGISKIRHAD